MTCCVIGLTTQEYPVMTAIAFKPTPLPPVVTPDGPQTWVGKPVAGVTAKKAFGPFTRTVHEQFVASTIDHPSAMDNEAFVNQGTDFTAAIAAARASSRAATDITCGDPMSPAVALLQARDGVYYSTDLTLRNGYESGAIDGPTMAQQGWKSLTVTPLTPDLKAIVGNDSIIRFADGQTVAAQSPSS